MMAMVEMANRLRGRGRIPFGWLLALVGVGVALAGAAVVDDYGVGVNDWAQRSFAILNADYVMGRGDVFPAGQDRYYGMVFEMPLLMAERALGLEDSRDIFLMRHLVIHLFYIVGGVFCGLLVYRMLGSRWVALLAMLLFLWHPRLYAHSFFNGKDIPFTVMFMIALYLMHRAFRRDSVGAFAVLGVVVGLAVNLRPFALLLPAAVLAMRGLDWQFAANSGRRKRVLVTGGVFAGAVLLSIYISHPYYWENPLRFLDSVPTLLHHPVMALQIFRGQVISSHDVPPEYIPVWFGITTPLAVLLLGGLGALAVCWRGVRSPGLVLRSGELRFLLAALGCLVLPAAVAVALGANIYDGWRNLYFLWGPFCLLAAAGLYWGVRGGVVRSKGWLGGGKLRRIAVWVVAAAGLANMVYAIVSLHPNQYVYFNVLVNRAGADELGERYYMGFEGVAFRQGIEYLLESYPDETLYLPLVNAHRALFPAGERERIARSEERPDFYVGSGRMRELRGMPDGPVVYEERAYGSAFLTVSAPRLVWGAGLRPGAEVYRAAYERVVGEGSPAAWADFDVYLRDGVLYYVRDDCGVGDTEARFFLHVFPAEDDSLPVHRREFGFDNRSFVFGWRGGFFDGKCITQEPLPDYAVTRISTGQWVRDERRELWRAEINPLALARLQDMEVGLASWELASDGFFELYWEGDRLVYYRDSCAAEDTLGRFFLHIFPADGDDLPVGRGEYGFDNLGFDFSEYGVWRGGKCLAEVSLPGYEIGRIRTGQYAAGEGEIWVADLPGGE